MASASRNIDTLVLHGGAYRTDPATGATAVPIYQSTSFNLGTTERADRLVNFDEIGFVYTRLGNPTQDALEERLAAIEGGVAALALACAPLSGCGLAPLLTGAPASLPASPAASMAWSS